MDNLKHINFIKSKRNTKENLTLPHGIIPVDSQKFTEFVNQLRKYNDGTAEFAIYVVENNIYIPH